jgi:hypothetical protein
MRTGTCREVEIGAGEARCTTLSFARGTILDGTGAAALAGDVAIDGDRLSQVGGGAGPGKCESAVTQGG